MKYEHVAGLLVVSQPGSSGHVLLIGGPRDMLVLEKIDDGGDVRRNVVILQDETCVSDDEDQNQNTFVVHRRSRRRGNLLKQRQCNWAEKGCQKQYCQYLGNAEPRRNETDCVTAR